jgi:hypothetical protein
VREEVKQILTMVEEGKITAEQAAQLMDAGRFSNEENPESGPVPGKARWLKVKVYDMATNKRKVNVAIPLALVSVGLKLGIKYGLDREELKRINYDEIMQMIEGGAEGKMVDVLDEESGERVEVYVE